MDGVGEEMVPNSSTLAPPWLPSFLGCSYFTPCTDNHLHPPSNPSPSCSCSCSSSPCSCPCPCSSSSSSSSSSHPAHPHPHPRSHPRPRTYPPCEQACNRFCIDCSAGPLCPAGTRAGGHSSHLTLQIRKASRDDAVRISDIGSLLDVTLIQTYVINGAKIVFLLSRPPVRAHRDLSRACRTCSRPLVTADSVLFCSIQCKFWPYQSLLFCPFQALPKSKNNNNNNSNNDISLAPSTPQYQEQPCSFRIGHKRKGIPHRAALC